MINAKDFVEAARALGFEWYCGVPCSYLTPFINYVINDDTLNYISSANEGDAVASACGMTMGGKRAIAMMQNSGLGNAVSPLTSLAHTFEIPILIICTHRGQPGISDEPQHALMGEITTDLFDTMRIPWEPFPTERHEIADVLARADKHMERENKPYALIMSKGTVAPEKLLADGGDTKAQDKVVPESKFSVNVARPNRHQVLSEIVVSSNPAKDVVIATTGFTGRELYAVEDRNNHFYMVGSMGCASSLGLGLSLARPDLNVIVIDGDGAGLMRMGNFATLGKYGRKNLTHVLLDNEAHDSTGAQSTVSANIDFAEIAAACGYRQVLKTNELTAIRQAVSQRPDIGPTFLHMKIATGTIENLPRPTVTPPAVYARLRALIGS